MQWDFNMSTARVVGVGLFVSSFPVLVAIALNSQARKHGGHNLLPLIYPAGLLILVGLGLALDRPWSRLFAQLVSAATGILWISKTLQHLTLYDFSTNLIFGFIPGVALLIPALVAGRTYVVNVRRERPAV